MTYNQVQDGDENIANTDYVKFDAFFLRDLDGDGYAESVRGSCRKIGQNDTLYMELSVQTNGQFEDGIITINGTNMTLKTAIPKDNEIKENVIGSNIKEIKFNTIKSGTQKLVTGDISALIGNNINNYTKINSVTIKGTHVAEDGTRTEIEKTVEFTIDWHGTVRAEMPSMLAGSKNLNQELDLSKVINEEDGTFTVEETIGIQEANNQLLLERAHIEAEIPELNGYAPTKVELVGNNGTYAYSEETKMLVIDRIAELDENGTIIKNAYDSNYGGNRYNKFKVKITYPLEAYRVVEGNEVELKIPVKGYYEGYNNQDEEFENPYKSNTANSTFIVTLSNPRGTVAIFDITVGKYIGSPRYGYIVSKEKPLKVYNGVSEIQDNDTYTVKWYGATGSDGKSTGMIMKEKPEEVSDKFIKTDSTLISMEEVTTNIGIYFSNQENMLGEDGWIHVYDNETNELLETFTKDNWDKYNSNNIYEYQRPVKHIRVETSATNENTSISVYNVKKLDDEKITSEYTREEFDNLQYIRSSIIGYLGENIVNTDVHNAEYEETYTYVSINLNKHEITTQETEKNMTITIGATGQENLNQEKWLNGTFLLKLPDNIVDVNIKEVKTDNSEVKIISYEQFEIDEKRYIKINTENNNPTTFNIDIDCEITPNPQMLTKTESFVLYAYNENAIDYWNKVEDTLDINDNLNTTEMIGSASTSISLVSPNSLLTSEMITNYDDKGSIAIAPRMAEVEKAQSTVDMNVVITNNYSNTISEVKIVGRIPFEGNKYVINKGELGSNFGTTMTNQGIIVPESLQEIATVYYSENEDATNDLSDSQNGWTTTPSDFSKVKSYLIDLGDYALARGENQTFTYAVNLPKGLNYNQVSYGHHAVYFSLDTAEGKYKTQVEPNKVGIMIAKKYELELTKYQKDKEKIVSGATYSITEEGKEEARTRVTNINGKFTLENLYIDRTYILKEIKTPNEYELNPEEIKFKATEENDEIKLTIISGTTKRAEAVQPQGDQGYKIAIDVEDEVRASLKIVKTEKDTGTIIPSVTFKLTGKNFEKGRTLRTNTNGEVILKGLSIGEEYTLEEVKAEGYYIEAPIKFVIENNSGTYAVNITEGQVKTNETTETDGIPTIVLNIENEKIPRYNLQINKVIKDETTPLAGAKFRLFKGTEKIEDYITDENGIITINNLYQYEETKGIDQTYTLKELLAPDGYSAVKDITFKVSKNAEGLLVMDIQEGKIKEQTVGVNNTVIITIEDSKSFKLVKTDGETGDVLPNTKFAIYNVDNGTNEIARDSKNNILGTKEIINGREYYTLTTNEKGEIEADLKEGLYKAVEVKASHDKYDITDNTYYFGIGASREAEKVMAPKWSDSYGGSGSDAINSVAETADGGYVAGGYFQGTIEVGENTYTSTGNDDGIIIKYSSIGEVEWVETFGGSSDDRINAVAETTEGGVIAGGFFYGTIEIENKTYRSNGRNDGIIVKYRADGIVEWVETFGGSSYDYISSVAGTVDGGYTAGGSFEGTIKVGDKTYTSNGKNDGIIIKCSKSREVEWVSICAGNSYDYIKSVTETADGGVIAGGEFRSNTIEIGGNTYTNKSTTSSYFDGIIIKYNIKGEIEWGVTCGGSSNDSIYSVVETKEGGVIAGGRFGGTIEIGGKTYTSNGNYDGIIIKYSKLGEAEWISTYGGRYMDNEISSITETADGEIITVGHFGNTIQIGDNTYTSKGGYDGIIIKYSSLGKIEWSTTFGSTSEDEINSVAVTADGRVIAGGYFASSMITVGDNTYTNKGSYDGIIIKYGEKEIVSPKIVSTAIIGGSDYDHINSIVGTADGGYIVGGGFEGTIEVGDKTYTSKSKFDGIIIKYSAIDEVEWVETIRGNSNDEIKSVAKTRDGGVIVGGVFGETIEVGDKIYTSKGGWDVIIIKYSIEGEVEWVETYGGSNGDEIDSVAETADGGLIVGGCFSEITSVGEKTYISKGESDGIIIKYSAEREVEWVETIRGSSNDEINSVAETADGGVIAGGEFYGATIQVGDKCYTGDIDDYNGIIIKYNKEGKVEWLYTYGGNKGLGTEDDGINSVSGTTDGGVIAGGYFHGPIQIGDKTYGSRGNQDGIIIKYSARGEVEWVRTIKGNRDDEINSVMEMIDGGYILGGSFGGTLEIGGKTYTSQYYFDGIIIKYSKEGKLEWTVTYGGNAYDRIYSVEETTDGEVIAGGTFNSSTITVGDKTYTSNGRQDGIIMKVVAYAGVPETELLSVENDRKKFKITTDVDKIDGVKGGSISGEGAGSYEKVKYGDTSTKEIIMTPDENYEIIGITVNGEEYQFTANEDGTYTMPQFSNMTENKHVVVTYSLKDNKITINKVDSKTKEPISGVKFKLDQIEERTNPENVIGSLTGNGETYTITEPSENEVEGVKGELTDNGETYTRTELSENEVTGVLGELTDNGETYTKSELTENEVTGVLGNLTSNGEYYFIQKEDGTYVPINGKTYQLANGGTEGIQNSTANSYIPIDLTGLTGKYAVVVNAQVSCEENYDSGYAIITENTTVPVDDGNTVPFMYISGTISSKDYISMTLEGGKIYYLHLGYSKDEIDEDEGDDQIVINSVKVYGAIGSSISYNFIEEDGKYKSTNQGQADTECNSYIPIDLTGLTGKYAVVVNGYISCEEENDFGYVTITEDTRIPTHYESQMPFMYISGTTSDVTTPTDYTSMLLEGGQKYYLHLGYRKNSIGNEGEDQLVINNIKLYETIDNNYTYNFIEENGKYKSTNQGQADTVCNSYIPIDLTGLTGKYALVVNAEVSSEGADYGYATITNNETRPAYNNTTGRFIYISGTQTAKDYTTVLEGGQKYYLHLGYRKDGSGNGGEDQVIINSVKLCEMVDNNYTFNFIEEDGKYKSTNQGKGDTVCNSYIPIDLTDYSGTYKLIVNAEISSQSNYDYGYARVTDNETKLVYNSSTGRFIYISGTQAAKDYTTVLEGGQKYYLHLGYRKDSSTDTDADTFTINNVRVELNEGDLYHTEITTNSEGQAITQIPFGKYSLTEVNPPEGYQPLENPVIIEFKGDNRAVIENENRANITVNANGEFVVENILQDKVIVHHYLKDRNGNYTTTKVTEDDVLYGNTDEEYTTKPHLDLEKYDLEKDESGNYIVPNNATGEFKDTDIEVFYYYEEKKTPITVHHYIEGTMTPVPLADGLTLEDLVEPGYTYVDNSFKASGYEGDNYTTNAIPDDKLSAEYELLEIPANASGKYAKDAIEISYYYKRTTRDINIIKYAEDGETPLEGVKFDIRPKGEEVQPKPLPKVDDIVQNGTFGFKEENGKFVSDNKEDGTASYSYIKVDLTGVENTVLKINAEISSEEDYDIGYVTVTETTKVPTYNEDNNYFIEISGTRAATDYKTELKGGKVYYIHFAYVKDGSDADGTDTFTINSIQIESTEKPKNYTYVTDSNGRIKVTLETGEYEITEIEAPEGYVLPENPTINVVITKDMTEKNIEITNDKIKGKVIVHHYIIGTNTPIKLQDGTYAEDEIKQGYIGDIYATKILENISKEYEFASVVGNTSGEYEDGTIEVTYYYQELQDIDIIKKWNHADNIYGTPENVTIELYADGEKINETTMTKANKITVEGEMPTEETWKYTFERLPKYTSDGKEIEYTISEKK